MKAPDFTTDFQDNTSGLPFSNVDELTKYALKKFESLGREKGSNIQKIIIALGHTKTSQIRPDQFEQFYNAVERL